MAEADQIWEDFLARQQHDITRTFQELAQRWRGIFAQEGARWFQVGQTWTLTTEQGSIFSAWHPSPKPLEETVSDFQHALRDMRDATDTRLAWEAYSGHGTFMSGPPPDQQTHDWMPDRGTVAYVEWVVRDAIRTGYEEGSPLRAEQIEDIRQQVWAQEIGQPHTGRAPSEQNEERSAAPWQPVSESLGPPPAARMMGSLPERIEIDTSDGEMGETWQAQLAALDARLSALMEQVGDQAQAHQQSHGMG
jgi:hypothetical protein